MRITVLSDTHNRHGELDVPAADILIHCGDFSGVGSFDEVEAFDAFLAAQPHRHKVVIAGNHDRCFETSALDARRRLTHAHYLQDEQLIVDGVKIYGSPWQPWFFDWAFNLPRGEPLRRVWERIPSDTEVLVTHGPPMGILDETLRGERVGCEDLARSVRTVAPSLHVFGHIHEAYGSTRIGETLFVNASNCDARYRPIHPPVLVERNGSGEWSLV